jgi:hypothetical protein
MRAKEFITEQEGIMTKRHQYPTVGVNIFTDSNYDRIYMLNRVMMAAASTDGKTEPEIEPESWAGKQNLAFPYTKADQDKLIAAYKAVGVKYSDLNKGDMKSHELDSTNKQSPIKQFRGYKK